jgi:hypothetical protein
MASFAEGGSLFFRGPGVAEPSWVAVADFTSYTAWYYPDAVIGGVGGWITPFGLSLGAPLTQAPCRTNGSCPKYTAATGNNGQFNLVPVTIQSVPPVQTLFGTLTTDGLVGVLAPSNFRTWHIVGRTQEIFNYTPTNSLIRSILFTFTDTGGLKVNNNPNGSMGILDIGTQPTVSNPGISIKLADFTDSIYYPGGVASYSEGNFGLLGTKSPLTTGNTYRVGKVK